MADASGRDPSEPYARSFAMPPHPAKTASRQGAHLYDPAADLRLAAGFLASIETGHPQVDVRLKALAAAIVAISGSLRRCPPTDIPVRWDDGGSRGANES